MSRKYQDLWQFSFSALTLNLQPQQNVVMAAGLPCCASASSPLETWKKVSRHPRSRSAAASHWTLPGQVLVSHWFSGRAKFVSHWTLWCLSLIGHLGPVFSCLSLDITRSDACLSLVLRQSEIRLSLDNLNACLSLVTWSRSSAASHWILPGQMRVSHWFSGRAKVVSYWTLWWLSLIGHIGPVYSCLSLDINRSDACLSLVLRQSEIRLSLDTLNACLSLITFWSSRSAGSNACLLLVPWEHSTAVFH